MQTIELEFLPDGSSRITEGRVSGARAVVQNALVNLLSNTESDPTFPDRGTDILDAAVSGIASSPRGAQHEANFAANRVLFFSREEDQAAEDDQLESVEFQARLVGGGVLEMEASFRTTQGEVLSLPINTSLNASS